MEFINMDESRPLIKGGLSLLIRKNFSGGIFIMRKNSNKFRTLLKNIKSCLDELHLKIMSEDIDQDSGRIKVGVETDEISMLMELFFRHEPKIIDISISADALFNTDCMLGICQVLNLLNAQLMNIGHFSINQETGHIKIQTSLDLSSQSYNRHQMLATIKDIIDCGRYHFSLLQPMSKEDRCPMKAFPDYFMQNEDDRINENNTIH
jgi:hypothetical protein